MRSPEPGAIRHPSGMTFEDELSVRYLSPGSFTIIPPHHDEEDDEEVPLRDPIAPQPFRLTPNTRKRRNQAFAIIAEPNSNPNSRSPSPSGRVSPFRGRGFNPAGSRHASPASSPPPPDTKRSLSRSQIPQPTRRRSTSPFGEKVLHLDDDFSSSGDNMPRPRSSRRPGTSGVTLSRSLGNISTTSTARSYRSAGYIPSRKPTFHKLSPIIGSSPEPSEYASNKSSPSKIPRSKSQPPSRIVSPNGSRNVSRANSRMETRNASRNVSRNGSRNGSRDPSRDPSRDASPANGEAKSNSTNGKYGVSSNRTISYKNAVSRVESYNKMAKGKASQSKPPIPTNNNNTNSSSNRPRQLERSNSNARANIKRIQSITKFTKSNVPKSNNATNNRNQNQNGSRNSSNKSNENLTDDKRNINFAKGSSAKPKTQQKAGNKDTTTTTAASSQDEEECSRSESEIDSNKGGQMKKAESASRLSDLLAPSTTAIVSTTTSTVTQPLNIDAHLEEVTSISSNDKPIMTPTASTAGSGRNTPSSHKGLSRTSSSSSLGKPAPLTASNSEKSITSTTKGSARHRLALKARSIISMGTIAEGSRSKHASVVEEAPETPATTELPPVDTVAASGKSASDAASSNKTINNNVPLSAGTANSGGGDPAAMESNVKSNINKIISPDNAVASVNNVVQKSANDKMLDARTMVAADVKPIRITVKEKGADMEVQSGNVRLPTSATNGIGERPNLPPTADSPRNQQSQDQSNPPAKTNVCSRLLATCMQKVPCACCKKKSKTMADGGHHTDDDEDDEDAAAGGCFKCRRKAKSKGGMNESAQTLREAEASEDEDGQQPKGKCGRFMSRMKCCRSNKVDDSSKPTGCCPLCRRGGGGSKKDALANRSVSMVGKPPKTGWGCTPKCECSKACCKNFLKTLFCFPCIACKKCKTKKQPKPSVSDEMNRRASQLTQKKSMTSTVHPVEDNRPKLDISLVEHSSHMRGAIPILPIPLAWICLFFNVFLPGVGTLFSGLICLCIGKPRFSPYDGMKQRIGAFLINCIIAFSQLFTVIFCFVGWGWSIWWGVIMLKIARKYRRVKLIEAEKERQEAMAPVLGPDGQPLFQSHHHHLQHGHHQQQPPSRHQLGRDLEKGS